MMMASTEQTSAVLVQKAASDVAQASLPFLVGQSNGIVAGIPTRVICQVFADQILVIVSQTEKVGLLTQVTMQYRPSNFPSWSFDEEDEWAEGTRTARAKSVEDQVPMPLGSEDASLLDACQLQRLFGSYPTGCGALYDLYCMHIAGRIQIAMTKAPLGNDESSTRLATAGLSNKRVVVGIALKHRKETNVHRTELNADDEDDEFVDFTDLANGERERFEGVLNLIDQAFCSAV